MSRVGVLTFSDGRDFVHQGIAGFGAAVEGRIAACGHRASRWSSAPSPSPPTRWRCAEARRLAVERPDLTIFNYPVWAFPHFSVHAAKATIGPLLLFSNIDPTYPGMVSLLAAGGSLDQIGRHHERLWGDVRRRCREQTALGARARRARGALARGVHLRPGRRSFHGHVHRGRAAPTSGCAASASTSKR